MIYSVKKEYVGKGLSVSVRKTMFKMININLDSADQHQLKLVHEAKLPYVTAKKQG